MRIDLESISPALQAELRDILSEHQLTQEQFAKRYRLSHSWVSKFLTGVMENPTINSLIVLRNAIQKEKSKG